jgi:hypothetical protein
MKTNRQIGTCSLCNVELEPTAMADHLPECIEEYRRESGGHDEDYPPKAYQIVFQSDRAPMYWMHLLVHDETTLGQLDSCLRDVWLEGRDAHSRFVIGRNVYSESEPTERAPIQQQGDFSTPIYEAFEGEEPFEYAYDLEETTELTGRVVQSTYVLPDQPSTPIRLLARNLPPEIPCRCGAQADVLCPTCVDAGDRGGCLCFDCAESHDCRARAEDYPSIENTPRALVRARGA